MTEKDLDSLFKELRDACPASAGDLPEQRLRLAFRARQAERRRRTSRYVLQWAASLAIVAALCFFLLRGKARKPSILRSASSPQEFIVLPYGQSDVPLEHPIIVRVQVPASEVSGLGIALPPLRNRERVEADLLIGQDGIARAIRVNQQVQP